MGDPTVRIVTGVDKLLRLIQEKERIKLSDAAKELSLPKKLIQEWVDFLEDEGLIGTEYTLTSSFLIAKKLSKKEIAKKEKEYGKKRDVFVRRIEVALNQLQDEDKVLNKLREKYSGLKETLGDNLSVVEEDIKELHHYEQIKDTFEQQAHEQQSEYNKELQRMNKELEAEEDRYGSILTDITEEIGVLKKESARADRLGSKEELLEQRVAELQKLLGNIIKQLSGERSHVEVHKDRLKKLESMAEKIEQRIKKKEEKEIAPLVKLTKEQEEKLQRIQAEVVRKVKERVSQIDEYEQQSEDIAQRFFEFFKRRAKTDALLQELGADEHQMEDELSDLMLKAKAFSTSTDKAEVSDSIKDIESKFKSFTDEKRKFHERVKDLNTFITEEKKGAQDIVK